MNHLLRIQLIFRHNLLRSVLNMEYYARAPLNGMSVFQPFSRLPSSPITTSTCHQAKNKVTLNFINRDGQIVSSQASVGENLLDCIIDNDVGIDGYGACEGTLSCSTCHLIFSQENYDALPDKPTDEENDMLDMAYGLTETSRLGCQVYVTNSMNGWTIKVPEACADARDV